MKGTEATTNADGDPDRFLAWLRDWTVAPADVAAEAAAWAQLVRDAFAYAERSHARAVSAEDTARIACRAGCGWCCYMPVITTAPEAAEAWRYAERHLTSGQLDDVRTRARTLPGSTPEPCPFLINERCSVYAARPLVCRGWNSTDVSICEHAHSIGYENATIPTVTKVHGVYANAAEALSRGIADRGGEPAVALRAAVEVLAGGGDDAL